MELVADGDGDETGVHHLQHVLVLQLLGDWNQLHRFLALLDQPAVERLEVLPVARRLADVNRLPGQLVHARDPRPGRSGDHQLAHVLEHGDGEVHHLAALRSDEEVGGGDVTPSFEQRRDELVSRHRDEHHVKPERLFLEALVHVVLERLEHLVRRSALLSPIHEEEGPAVDDQRPQHPAPLDLVPVTLDGREQHFLGGVRPGGRGGVGLGCNQLPGQQDGEDSGARRAAHDAPHTTGLSEG